VDVLPDDQTGIKEIKIAITITIKITQRKAVVGTHQIGRIRRVNPL
jgi:hypothetical protein